MSVNRYANYQQIYFMNYISGKGNTNKYKCALLFWLSCEYTLSMIYEYYKFRAYIYPKSYIYAKAPPQFF